VYFVRLGVFLTSSYTVTREVVGDNGVFMRRLYVIGIGSIFFAASHHIANN
jgi:hypothetical protein